jgi:hypothetical protein
MFGEYWWLVNGWWNIDEMKWMMFWMCWRTQKLMTNVGFCLVLSKGSRWQQIEDWWILCVAIPKWLVQWLHGWPTGTACLNNTVNLSPGSHTLNIQPQTPKQWHPSTKKHMFQNASNPYVWICLVVLHDVSIVDHCVFQFTPPLCLSRSF